MPDACRNCDDVRARRQPRRGFSRAVSAIRRCGSREASRRRRLSGGLREPDSAVDGTHRGSKNTGHGAGESEPDQGPPDDIGRARPDDNHGQLLVFLGTLYVTLSRADEQLLAVIALSGGLLSSALIAVIGALPAALAFNIADTASAQVVKALYDLVWPLQVLIAFPSAVLIGAASCGSLRARLWPRPIGYLGAAGAAVVLVGGATWSRTGYWSPSHGYDYAALFVFLSWVAVTSALLMLSSRRT